MLTLIATPAGADSNAYATLEEAEAYMSSLLHAENWNSADDEKKTAALIQAARWMETVRWSGKRSSFGQALSWPRRGAVDREGAEIPHDCIPCQVKDANAEFAYRLLVEDRAADAKKGVQFGDIRTSDQERVLIPPSVKDLLGPLADFSSTIRIARS